MERKLLRKIAEGMDIQKGELVLLHFWGEEEEIETLYALASEVAAIGASPLLLWQSRKRNLELFQNAGETCFDEKYFSVFRQVDTVIDILAQRPALTGGVLEQKQMERYRKYLSGLFQNLSSAEKMIQLRLPTAENAEDAGIEVKEFTDRLTKAYDIDYGAIREHCAKLTKMLQGMEQVVLRTGKNQKAVFTILNRKWYEDYGNGDLPCGEIYIAPVEDMTEGEIYFERLYLEEGSGYLEQVTLFIKDGRIRNSDHSEVNQYLEALEDSRITELGIGLNPNVAALCGCAVLDEKMEHSFHIGLGINIMFGGTVSEGRHTDFVGIGELWSTEGRKLTD